MLRTTSLITTLCAVVATGASASTFAPAPLLPAAGIDVLDRAVTRERVQRDLFGSPWATAVVGHVDVYDRFPYLESHWFQVVSDASWNRLLVGEIEGDLSAWNGTGSTFGALSAPRGLTADARGRLYVADSGNRRVLAFDVVTEYDHVTLVPRFAIPGFANPYAVAHSDAGTPFDYSDDRLYVADAGASRVLRYDLADGGATFRASVGELGSGPGHFAGPMAIAVGHSDGLATDRVYVADSHNHRIVELRDAGDHFEWNAEQRLDAEGITSLDTDHWGNVYAASPEWGVTKLTASLEPVARLDAGVERPRAFDIAFVTRTDHRTNETKWVGQGVGVVVEEWGDRSGLKLMRLGADVTDVSVRSDGGLNAAFTLTDRAAVAAEVVDHAGNVVAREDLGTRDAGHQDAALRADALTMSQGDYTMRVVAQSTYDGSPGGQSEAQFSWNGPAVAPNALAVVGIVPNPFDGSTQVRFAIPAGGVTAHSLAIYDLGGRLVRRLSSGSLAAGSHAVSWDGRDGQGRVVAAGVYLARLTAGRATDVRKVVYLR
jgi:flagellar hook assembly protein FlgD/sugar lactone lactonase YvrE